MPVFEEMHTHVPGIHRRAASRNTTPRSPISQSSDNSGDNETTASGRVKQVIACCRHHIERFAGVPRSAVYADGESMNSFSCFELRRPKSHSLPAHPPSQAESRRTQTSPPRLLNMKVIRQQSYQFYMDEDNHPFITTPSCIEDEGNSPKLMTFVTPPSR